METHSRERMMGEDEQPQFVPTGEVNVPIPIGEQENLTTGEQESYGSIAPEAEEGTDTGKITDNDLTTSLEGNTNGGDAVQQGEIIAMEEEQVIELAPPVSPRGASWFGGEMTFLKGMLGAGMLSLPNAFANSGIIAGPITYIIVGLLCIYTQSLLISVKRDLEKSDPGVQTFGQVAKAVAGRTGQIIISSFVIGLEWMFCAGMLIVIGSTVNDIWPTFPAYAMILVSFPFLSVLVSVRLLKDMWIIVTLGVCVYLFGVIGCTYLFGFADWADRVTDPTVADWRYIPTTIGTAIYSLEGINLVIPVEATLKKGQQGYSVVTAGTIIIVSLNSCFGFFGYLFGYGKCDIITNCLPQNWLSILVQIFLVITLFFTFPVTLFPATELVEDYLMPETKPMTWRETKRFALRTSQIGLAVMVAIAIPNLAIFTSLIGALFVTTIGFVIPPILYVMHFQPGIFVGCANLLFSLGSMVYVVGGSIISSYAIYLYYAGESTDYGGSY